MRRPSSYRSGQTLPRTIHAVCLAEACCAFSSPAWAPALKPGAAFANSATATYSTASGNITVTSNTVVLTVGELLDVAVASLEAGRCLSHPGAAGQVLKFAVTNGGNGPEAFKLATVASGGGDDFDLPLRRLSSIAMENGPTTRVSTRSTSPAPTILSCSRMPRSR